MRTVSSATKTPVLIKRLKKKSTPCRRCVSIIIKHFYLLQLRGNDLQIQNRLISCRQVKVEIMSNFLFLNHLLRPKFRHIADSLVAGRLVCWTGKGWRGGRKRGRDGGRKRGIEGGIEGLKSMTNGKALFFILFSPLRPRLVWTFDLPCSGHHVWRFTRFIFFASDCRGTCSVWTFLPFIGAPDVRLRGFGGKRRLVLAATCAAIRGLVGRKIYRHFLNNQSQRGFHAR